MAPEGSWKKPGGCLGLPLWSLASMPNVPDLRQVIQHLEPPGQVAPGLTCLPVSGGKALITELVAPPGLCKMLSAEGHAVSRAAGSSLTFVGKRSSRPNRDCLPALVHRSSRSWETASLGSGTAESLRNKRFSRRPSLPQLPWPLSSFCSLQSPCRRHHPGWQIMVAAVGVAGKWNGASGWGGAPAAPAGPIRTWSMKDGELPAPTFAKKSRLVPVWELIQESAGRGLLCRKKQQQKKQHSR